jgi:hypothetical protein
VLGGSIGHLWTTVTSGPCTSDFQTIKRWAVFQTLPTIMNVKARIPKILKVLKVKIETSKFDTMTKNELLAECEKLKITKYKSKNKPELIQLIESFNQLNIN